MVDTSLQNLALFLVVFVSVVAGVLVALRVWARLSVNQFGWDDGLIVVAMILAIGETYTSWKCILANYIGIHIWDIPVDRDIVLGLKYIYAVQVFYNPVMSIAKTSILIFLLRLSGQKKEIKQAIWPLLIFNNLLMIAVFAGVIFQCTPIAYNWQPDILGGYCINQGAFYATTAAIFLVTDILILLIPYWIVIGLKMARKTKIAVIGVFFIGFIGTIMGVIRLVIIVKLFFGTRSADFTHNIGFVASMVENNLVIITASVPALKPLARRWFPRLFSTLSDNTYGNHNGGSRALSSNKYGCGTKNGFKGSRISSGNGVFKLEHRPDVRDGRTEYSSRIKGGYDIGERDSEESIMIYEGIIKTTNVSVRYGDGDEDGKNEISNSQYGMRTRMESL